MSELKIRRFEVPSDTTSEIYVVTEVNGTVVACVCKGFSYRQYCKHHMRVGAVPFEERANVFKEIPVKTQPPKEKLT
jgi:hypothetical protein